MVTSLLIDSDIALEFRNAVRAKYGKEAQGKIGIETNNALKNHIELLKGNK